MKKILITGSGGIGGVNFVRALRAVNDDFFLVGTDFNQYYLQFPEVDVRIRSPRHSDPQFVNLISKTINEHKIDFLHPQPSSEAQIIAKNKTYFSAKTLLPEYSVIIADKLETQETLQKKNIPVATTKIISSEEEVMKAFDSLSKGEPLWVRAKKGAGGFLSLLCNNSEEAKYWMKLWVIKKNLKYDDFMIQKYLPGRNIAWDSFWFNGKLICSFTRERLEYPFKHISPSGITGTPTVSKIIIDSNINKIGTEAVKAMDGKPHGNYSVDLKGDSENRFYVTEIDSGKFHTTTPLWGFISTRILKQDNMKNIPYLYVKLGMGEISEPEVLGNDIYPVDLYLLRHIDCGVWIWKEDGFKEKVL
jgi:carbamoyl-phosphate synthase large subunit